MGFSYGFRRAGVVALTLLAGVFTGTAMVPSAAAATGCRTAVPGDVNGDGHAEVAVSVDTFRSAGGAVQIFYGRSNGLVTDASGTARDDQYLEQASPGIPGRGEPGSLFGGSLTVADFDNDNVDDVAIGRAEHPLTSSSAPAPS